MADANSFLLRYALSICCSVLVGALRARPFPDARVQVHISGLPNGVRRVLLRHYRIDETHSNAWTVWKKMGSPQDPSPAQYRALEAAGQLEAIESPRWVDAGGGEAMVELVLPRQGVSMLQVSW